MSYRYFDDRQQVVGSEGFCTKRSSVRTNLPSGEQTSREVRGTRGVRRRIQVRPFGE